MTIIGEIFAWIWAIAAIYTVICVLYIAIYGIIKKESWAKDLKGCLLFYIVVFIILPVIWFGIKQCKDELKEKNTIEQLQNKVNYEVYICTG